MEAISSVVLDVEADGELVIAFWLISASTLLYSGRSLFFRRTLMVSPVASTMGLYSWTFLGFARWSSSSLAIVV